MPGDARKRRKVSKVFGGFRVLYHKSRRKPLAGLSESLEHIPGRLQRGGRVPQRQARPQRVVPGTLSQCLSQGECSTVPFGISIYVLAFYFSNLNSYWCKNEEDCHYPFETHFEDLKMED